MRKLILVLVLCLGCAATESGKGVDWLSRAKLAEDVDMRIGDKGRDITKDSPVNTGTQYFLGVEKDNVMFVVLVAALILSLVRMFSLRQQLDNARSEAAFERGRSTRWEGSDG